MARKRHTSEQIIRKLLQAEVLLRQGNTVGLVARELEITEPAYYRRRKEYGGMRVNQAKRLKDLEKENAGLKRIVAEQSLDISILKNVAQGNF